MSSSSEILELDGDNKEIPARDVHPGPRSHLAETDPVSVPISALLPGYSPRPAGENPEHVQLSAAARDLPPILVHRSTTRVIDRMHRLRAAKLRGDETIPVSFFEGDARLAGSGAGGVQGRRADRLPHTDSRSDGHGAAAAPAAVPLAHASMSSVAWLALSLGSHSEV
ncbi:hypothetical protein GCM10017556_11770 [Micromonospora sagamiensis]|uniref:ParB-like nuclease domain-containing protein n=1 Tax=Micromonospora sagamiensis TaxID=47875 RepID=A0A562WBU4_9ACTN|nr:ParB-like nuclease domain-containing protein [Micromonospora sagamiensis]BCL13438.1 hypothetical protein GCM10017556_11770 [Micromonospora sagamiensis]